MNHLLELCIGDLQPLPTTNLFQNYFEMIIFAVSSYWLDFLVICVDIELHHLLYIANN